MRKSLTKAEILRRKNEISELFVPAKLGPRESGSLPDVETCGKLRGHLQHDGLRLMFSIDFHSLKMPNDSTAPQADCKVFFSPAKRLGNAVQRNRAKRLQREFYRHSKEELCLLAGVVAQEFLAPFSSYCMNYRWAFVIYHPARRSQPEKPCEFGKEGKRVAPYRDALGDDCAQAWDKAWHRTHRPDFLWELQRYQTILRLLQKTLRKQWLSRTIPADPPPLLPSVLAGHE